MKLSADGAVEVVVMSHSQFSTWHNSSLLHNSVSHTRTCVSTPLLLAMSSLAHSLKVAHPPSRQINTVSQLDQIAIVIGMNDCVYHLHSIKSI